MQITRQTEYAIRTVLELSRIPFGEQMPVKAISKKSDIPELFLKKTVQLLSRSGLVSTRRGAGGGVRLSVPSDRVTIARVITAVEGKMALNVCLRDSDTCPNTATCQVHRVMRRGQRAMEKELNKDTFADLVARERV